MKSSYFIYSSKISFILYAVQPFRWKGIRMLRIGKLVLNSICASGHLAVKGLTCLIEVKEFTSMSELLYMM